MEEKIQSIEDEALRRFVSSFLGMTNRRIYSSDLSDVLNRFGDNYRNEFNEKIHHVVEHERAATSYNNLITNRHNAAHSSGANITLRDVKIFYEEGHIILDFFREALIPDKQS